VAETVDLSVFAERSLGAPYIADYCLIDDLSLRARDYFKILLVTRGTGRMVEFVRDEPPRVRRIVPGDLMLLRPVDLLRFKPDDRDGIDTTFVSFSVDDWASFSGLANLDRAWIESPTVPLVRRDRGDQRTLRPFELALSRYSKSPTPLDLVQFLSNVAGWMFSSKGPTGIRLRGPMWLTSAIIAMSDEQNLRGGFPRLLELTHVSRSHLAATVRRYYETAPRALVTDLRLRHAAKLLASSDDTIARIATRCGFESVPYFSTAFRQANGITPREARMRSRRADC
jgi:AraC-like DNA-binding protein